MKSESLPSSLFSPKGFCSLDNLIHNFKKENKTHTDESGKLPAATFSK